jgi:hypothetical protein
MQRTANGDATIHFRNRIFLSSALIFAAIRQIDKQGLGDDEGERQFMDALAAATAVIEANSTARIANTTMRATT